MEEWQGQRNSQCSQAASPAMVLNTLGQSGLNYELLPKPAGAQATTRSGGYATQAKAHISPGRAAYPW